MGGGNLLRFALDLGAQQETLSTQRRHRGHNRPKDLGWARRQDERF